MTPFNFKQGHHDLDTCFLSTTICPEKKKKKRTKDTLKKKGKINVLDQLWFSSTVFVC